MTAPVKLPPQQPPPAVSRLPHVYFVNNSYVLFEEADVIMVRDSLRAICEPMNTSNSDQFISAWNMPPETAATLLQYGLIKVYRPRETDSLAFDVEPSIYKAEKEKKTINPEDIDLKKAAMVAKGKKIKMLKKAMEKESIDGVANKVRKVDLATVEVTEEEIEAAAEQLAAQIDKRKDKSNEAIKLPPVHYSSELYEPIAMGELSLPSTEQFRNRRVVWHDLWRRGFYLTTGSRFGCDLMVYEAKPGEVHAAFLVQIAASTSSISVSSLSALSRIATQVKKSGLLAIVALDSHVPYYLKFNWFRPY